MPDAPVAQKILTTQDFWRALVAAGVFSEDDAGMIRRIVIDVDSSNPGVVMHVDRWASERMLQVVPTLEGVEIREVDRG